MISPRSLADWILDQTAELLQPAIRRALPAGLTITIEPIRIHLAWDDEAQP